MDSRIKKSYSKLKMSEDAKKRIYTQISESVNHTQSPDSEKQHRKIRMEGYSLRGWKAGLAACLAIALIVPTGVYAAGKISEYFTVTIDKEKYQAKINMNASETIATALPTDSQAAKKPAKYIRVQADFGKDYQLEDKGELYCYAHKDGFDAGKDFYYEVLYMDVGKDFILNLYNQEHMEEIVVNNHKAILCKSNAVQGSRYDADHDTDYNTDLYVFYEEYGYVINYCGMQGLGQKKLVSLAESTVVTETKKKHAATYENLSQYCKASTIQPESEFAKNEVTSPIKKVHEKIEDEGFTYQVTDVTVSSKLKDTNPSKLNDNMLSEKSKLWDANGNLKPYIREKVKAGDGISQPERMVTDSEKVQPKIVYITMKVKAKKGKQLFQLPGLCFIEKEGEKYYDTRLYWQYNRPAWMEGALMDFMPCYFKETAGGKGFWLKEMEGGTEQVYHFAYIVDEDMTDNMVLGFGFEWGTEDHVQYVNISK